MMWRSLVSVSVIGSWLAIALLIAAMSAEGKSVIHNIDQIDRGYQDIDKRLNRIGAHIERIRQ